MSVTRKVCLSLLAGVAVAAATTIPASAQQQKRPNIVMLMTDDTGWNDFGAYSLGGAGLGHPTPNVDRIAKEGAVFNNWYGQASCTAGRASFITGRIPIRSALSIVVAPGDENRLRKETPTIAEFFQKNGYTTYFSGKWHLGDKPDAYPTEHGFDEMKHFAAYYAGVYSYNDTSKWFHPWFPSLVLHGCQLHQDAQPDQRGAGVQGQVASRRLFRLADGNGRRHRPDHG
jgi:arylsulfatase